MTRMRKPRNAAEHAALAMWREARPSAAMTLLSRTGYGECERREFLVKVAGCCESDTVDFSSPSYVMDSCEHRFTIHLSLPLYMMGAVHGWHDYRECSLCGKRVPAESLAESA